VSVDPTAVAAQVAAIRDRIAAAGGGRAVKLLAVTKGFGADAVAAAAAAGCDGIGENYAQELLSKRAAVEAAGAEVHFIGQLQSNKVRVLAGLVDVWESVDRPRLVHEIARRVAGARVFIQVDATGEHVDGKGGCPLEDVAGLVAEARTAGLVVEGLMTVGPTSGDPTLTRSAFRAVTTLADALELPGRSMGMTADLELAVQEGSTQVRVGTALFGPRPG
jgi:pyridoxal phosphate enzyme (YggS family)